MLLYEFDPIAVEEEQALAVEVAHVVRNDLREIRTAHRVMIVVGLLEQFYQSDGLLCERRRGGKGLAVFRGTTGRCGGEEERGGQSEGPEDAWDASHDEVR